MSKTSSLRIKLDRLDRLGFDTTPVRKSLNADRTAGRLTDAIIARHERKADQVIRALDPGVVGAVQFIDERHGKLRATPKGRGRTLKTGNTLAHIASYLPKGDPRRAKYGVPA